MTMTARTPPPGEPKGVLLRDLLATRFPPREYLLHPILRQGESMLLWAPTGVGKTMLTLTMALAMAGGGRFLGWAAEKPRRVLVTDGEMSIEDVQERLRMLADTVEGFDAEAAAGNLKIMARTHQAPGVVFPDIAKAGGQDAVLKAAREHRADLVVLDNFSTLAEVEDENAASAMNPVLAFLLRMKGERLASILVHHAGKGGQSYRGSSKLAATFEVILGLTVDGARDVTSGAAFTATFEKFRGTPHTALAPRDIALSGPADGRAEWFGKGAESDDVRRLAAAIRSAAFATQNEVAEHLRWDASKVSRMKARMFAQGVMRRGEVDAAFRAVVEGRREAAGAEGRPEDF